MYSLTKSSRMKYIDLREAWVQQLRDRKLCEFDRVPGAKNVADFFTKVLDRVKFQEWEESRDHGPSPRSPA